MYETHILGTILTHYQPPLSLTTTRNHPPCGALNAGHVKSLHANSCKRADSPRVAGGSYAPEIRRDGAGGVLDQILAIRAGIGGSVRGAPTAGRVGKCRPTSCWNPRYCQRRHRLHLVASSAFVDDTHGSRICSRATLGGTSHLPFVVANQYPKVAAHESFLRYETGRATRGNGTSGIILLGGQNHTSDGRGYPPVRL